jgi:hypothetical protein
MDKFVDLMKLGISLINEIRGLIKEILKFRVDLGQNCKKLKSKDQSEKAGEGGYYREFN